jgi:hypothetical protein
MDEENGPNKIRMFAESADIGIDARKAVVLKLDGYAIEFPLVFLRV